VRDARRAVSAAIVARELESRLIGDALFVRRRAYPITRQQGATSVLKGGPM